MKPIGSGVTSVVPIVEGPMGTGSGEFGVSADAAGLAGPVGPAGMALGQVPAPATRAAIEPSSPFRMDCSCPADASPRSQPCEPGRFAGRRNNSRTRRADPFPTIDRHNLTRT